MQYLNTVTAFAMTSILLLSVRRRNDQSLLYASLALMISFLSDIDEFYLPLDNFIASITGKYNLFGLFGTMALVLGVYFLARAVLRASWTEHHRIYERSFRISLIAAFIGMVISFWSIDTSHSSTAFMRDFGAQPAAAIYSMIQFGYIGVVMVILGIFTASAIGNQTHRLRKVGAGLIAAACACAAIMVISVFGMDITHLNGNSDLMATFATIYSPATSITMLLLCMGLCSFPLARSLQKRSERKHQTALFQALLDTHAKITHAPEVIAPVNVPEDIDAALYRLFIEIEDGLLSEPAEASILSDKDRETLRATEDYLQIK